MDTVILLFRLIVKIATVEGVACRGHPHFNSVQGGSVCVQNLFLVSPPNQLAQIRGHVGLHPSSFDGLQYPIFVLEVLLGAILAVYASIALTYALRYYKKTLHTTNYIHTQDKPARNRCNPLYTDYHEA